MSFQNEAKSLPIKDYIFSWDLLKHLFFCMQLHGCKGLARCLSRMIDVKKICQQQSSCQLPWAKRASERAHPCLSIRVSPHCGRTNFWKNYVAVAMKWVVSSCIAPCRTAPMPWDLQPYTETCASFNNEDWWDADTYLQVKPSMRQWKGTFITSHAWTAAKRCRSSIALCTTSTSRKNKVIIFSWSSTHLSSLVTVRAAKRVKPWPESHWRNAYVAAQPPAKLIRQSSKNNQQEKLSPANQITVEQFNHAKIHMAC